MATLSLHALEQKSCHREVEQVEVIVCKSCSEVFQKIESLLCNVATVFSFIVLEVIIQGFKQMQMYLPAVRE